MIVLQPRLYLVHLFLYDHRKPPNRFFPQLPLPIFAVPNGIGLICQKNYCLGSFCPVRSQINLNQVVLACPIGNHNVFQFIPNIINNISAVIPLTVARLLLKNKQLVPKKMMDICYSIIVINSIHIILVRGAGRKVALPPLESPLLAENVNYLGKGQGRKAKYGPAQHIPNSTIKFSEIPSSIIIIFFIQISFLNLILNHPTKNIHCGHPKL